VADETSSAAGSDERAAATLSRVLAGSTAMLLVLTRPLWTGAGLPKVPWFSWMPRFVEPIDALACAALPVALTAAAVGLRTRFALTAATAIALPLVAGDQHRLQAWMYQFLLLAFVLVMLEPRQALTAARLLTASIYVHSGLSKFDVSFHAGTGRQFVSVLLDPDQTPGALVTPLILSMPLGELLIGLAFLQPSTRRIGLVAATVMHAALVGLLGPWGLNHHGPVLLWNLYFVAQNLILFGQVRTLRTPHSEIAALRSAFRTPCSAIVWSVVCAAMVLPSVERWGLWDVWPSWGLYASHDERTYVYVTGPGVDELPQSMRAHLLTADEGWRRLDLAAWSLAVRGCPTYPSNRAMLGLADGLARRHPHLHWRVVLLGRAGWISGSRDREVLDGSEAIRARAAGFALNATGG